MNLSDLKEYPVIFMDNWVHYYMADGEQRRTQTLLAHMTGQSFDKVVVVLTFQEFADPLVHMWIVNNLTPRMSLSSELRIIVEDRVTLSEQDRVVGKMHDMVAASDLCDISKVYAHELIRKIPKEVKS